jgi:5-methylcytosine-specific restriction endonuclease McrA
MVSDTLVLNCEMKAVDRIPWQESLTLVYQTKVYFDTVLKGRKLTREEEKNLRLVEVVEEYDDWVVNSASEEWRVPSIIRWLKVVPRRRQVLKFSRENVYIRDNGECQYCGRPLHLYKRNDKSEFTFDHVIPRSLGGQTTWENVVISCVDCNKKKGNKSAEQAGLELRTIPSKPKRLGNNLAIDIPWRVGMPDSWRIYMRDTLYWKDELEK